MLGELLVKQGHQRIAYSGFSPGPARHGAHARPHRTACEAHELVHALRRRGARPSRRRAHRPRRCAAPGPARRRRLLQRHGGDRFLGAARSLGISVPADHARWSASTTFPSGASPARRSHTWTPKRAPWARKACDSSSARSRAPAPPDSAMSRWSQPPGV
jgi:hypothetical protein